MEFIKKIEKYLVPILICWLIFIVILMFIYKFPCNLNEWGDFLAGITSPAAFLLLVMGYFQQKEELKSNTAELARQAEQLSKQTEILEFQHLILKGPDLHFSKEIINEEECIIITNKGAMAINILVSPYASGAIKGMEFEKFKIAALGFNESTSFPTNINIGIQFHPEWFEVVYRSLQDTKYRIQVTSGDTNKYSTKILEISLNHENSLTH